MKSEDEDLVKDELVKQELIKQEQNSIFLMKESSD
jgi:hypothetical protein